MRRREWMGIKIGELQAWSKMHRKQISKRIQNCHSWGFEKFQWNTRWERAFIKVEWGLWRPPVPYVLRPNKIFGFSRFERANKSTTHFSFSKIKVPPSGFFVLTWIRAMSQLVPICWWVLPGLKAWSIHRISAQDPTTQYIVHPPTLYVPRWARKDGISSCSSVPSFVFFLAWTSVENSFSIGKVVKGALIFIQWKCGSQSRSLVGLPLIWKCLGREEHELEDIGSHSTNKDEIPPMVPKWVDRVYTRWSGRVPSGTFF